MRCYHGTSGNQQNVSMSQLSFSCIRANTWTLIQLCVKWATFFLFFVVVVDYWSVGWPVWYKKIKVMRVTPIQVMPLHYIYDMCVPSGTGGHPSYSIIQWALTKSILRGTNHGDTSKRMRRLWTKIKYNTLIEMQNYSLLGRVHRNWFENTHRINRPNNINSYHKFQKYKDTNACQIYAEDLHACVSEMGCINPQHKYGYSSI